jgi:hypothetical protein
MAAFILESLVLRGVVVLRDTLASVVRFDTSAVDMGVSGVASSMRHSSPRLFAAEEPSKNAAGAYGLIGVLPGVGRSRCLLSLLPLWLRPTAAASTLEARGSKALTGF